MGPFSEFADTEGLADGPHVGVLHILREGILHLEVSDIGIGQVAERRRRVKALLRPAVEFAQDRVLAGIFRTEELDEITRHLKQLEIEREAIKRENDQPKIQQLDKEIAELIRYRGDSTVYFGTDYTVCRFQNGRWETLPGADAWNSLLIVWGEFVFFQFSNKKLVYSYPTEKAVFLYTT